MKFARIKIEKHEDNLITGRKIVSYIAYDMANKESEKGKFLNYVQFCNNDEDFQFSEKQLNAIVDLVQALATEVCYELNFTFTPEEEKNGSTT